jgi:hypothetical protein
VVSEELMAKLLDRLCAYEFILCFVLQHLPLLDARIDNTDDSTMLKTLRDNVAASGLTPAAKEVASTLLLGPDIGWKECVRKRADLRSGESGESVQ